MSREVNIKLPTKWDELNAKQLVFVAKLFHSEFSKTRYRFLTHAMLYFSGLKIVSGPITPLPSGHPVTSTGQAIPFKSGEEYLLKGKGEKPFNISIQQLQFAASRLEWLFEPVTELHPLPAIRKAKAVNSRLYKTTFSQFLTAENFYKAYQTTKDVQHLDALVACLYLKPGETFNDELVKKRSLYFRKAKFDNKYTAFLWYSGFRWFVSQQCPNLYSKSGDGEELKIRDHVLNMIRGLTEGDVTKNSGVLEVDTWEALYELDAKAADTKKLKEQQAKMKSNV